MLRRAASSTLTSIGASGFSFFPRRAARSKGVLNGPSAWAVNSAGRSPSYRNRQCSTSSFAGTTPSPLSSLSSSSSCVFSTTDRRKGTSTICENGTSPSSSLILKDFGPQHRPYFTTDHPWWNDEPMTTQSSRGKRRRRQQEEGDKSLTYQKYDTINSLVRREHEIVGQHPSFHSLHPSFFHTVPQAITHLSAAAATTTATFGSAKNSTKRTRHNTAAVIGPPAPPRRAFSIRTNNSNDVNSTSFCRRSSVFFSSGGNRRKRTISRRESIGVHSEMMGFAKWSEIARRERRRRFFSTGSGDGANREVKVEARDGTVTKEKEEMKKRIDSAEKDTGGETVAEKGTKHEKGEGGRGGGGKGEEEGGHKERGSMASGISAIVGSVGQRLPRMEWHVSDLVSVYGIVILLGALVLSPFVIEQMRKSETVYGDLDWDDPVAHTEKIIRHILLATDDGDDQNNSEGDRARRGFPRGRKDPRIFDNTVDLLTQIITSKTLENALVALLTRVIQSMQFKTACQTLLKNLWDDLVNDPETATQVVQLLNNAIQDENIKLSVKALIMQLIDDKEVYDGLLNLVIRLGNDKEVLDATQALLTDSAHKALNDPEILDHSMEFATDVVGDDVVQRTSGEALRNTVTYAVTPGLSAVLTIAGLGLVVFSLSAYKNARMSDKEAEAVDAALASMARSVQSGTMRGLEKLWSIPSRIISSCFSALVTVVLFPLRLVQWTISGVGKVGEAAYNGAVNIFVAIAMIPSKLLQGVISIAARAGSAVSNAARGIVTALSTSVASVVSRGVHGARSGITSVWSIFVSGVGRIVHMCGSAVGNVASLLGDQLSRLVGFFSASLGALSSFTQRTAHSAGDRLGMIAGVVLSSVQRVFSVAVSWLLLVFRRDGQGGTSDA